MPTLKELRISQALSQGDLAKLSGVAASTISHAENGTRKPTFVSRRKLAKALGVQPSEIQFK